MKYLLRAVGILGLFEGKYSRDLKTCLAWSKSYAPSSFAALERGFAELEVPDPGPVDIRPTVLELEKAYSAGVAKRTC